MAKTDTSLKVFISYARKDGSAFAEELVEALDVAGFDAFLDRNDIAAGEDWEKRLEGLIAAADTIVFVVTPGSVASAQCAWEIKTAEALAKRVIPVVSIEIPDADAPAWLGRLNYIFFSRGQSFSRSLKQLATALTTDAAWIREHTRIGELAERWIQRGRPDVLLLRGPELQSAEHWAAGATDGGPQPTDLQRSFIDASQHFEHAQAELESQRLAAVGVEQAAKQEALQRLSHRTRLGLVASGVLMVAAIGFFYWSVNAEGRFRAAQQQAIEAQKHSVDATIASEASRTDITGQLIAFATTGKDFRLGAEQRALFTFSAVEHLQDADTPLLAAFTKAQEEMRAGAASERPLLSTSLNGDIYLGRESPGRKLEALVVTAGSADGDDTDADAWEAMLRARGFTVHRLVNPSSAQFGNGLTDFLGDTVSGTMLQGQSQVAPSASQATAGAESNALYFFVFVGQVAAVNGQTWLGFSDTTATSFETSAARLNDVATALSARAAASVLVIDAPFTLDTGGTSLKRNS
jgi:hypothetical protein